ncbi:MAG: Coenzyme F420 hydrogenase/dehydrogenase, beta subunit C-terminal domain [Candidatus Heimdallarchaeaceae archaeon]
MSKTKLPSKSRPYNFGTLYRNVIKPGYCAVCGGCEGVCPVNAIKIVHDTPKLISTCISCGACVDVCLRYQQRKSIQHQFSTKFGLVKSVCVGYSTDSEIKKKAQNGGIVSTLLKVALENDIIDSAILTIPGENHFDPKPTLATSEKDILEAAGSKYTINPLLQKIYAIKYSNRKKVAVVGLPCHLETLSNIMEHGYWGADRRIILRIGLLCMRSYEHETLKMVVTRETSLMINDIVKMDIRAGKLYLTTNDGISTPIPLKKLKEARAPGCQYCKDLVSPFADIVVGNVGVEDTSNIIIVSTKLGEKILNLAKKNGIIETYTVDCQEWIPKLDAAKKLATIKWEKAKEMPELE